MTTERYSYSRLSKADSCLARYREEYGALGDRLPQTYDPLRETGKGVHACIERYVGELYAAGNEQDLSMVSLIVEDYFSNDREVTTTAAYDDVFFVFLAWAKGYRHNAETYLGAEFFIERALPESDAIITAIPDRIDKQRDKDGFIVVSDDCKSGYRGTANDDDAFQGSIVCWINLDWFPGIRVGWRVNFPRPDSRSDIEEFKPEYSQRLEARMRSIIARIHNAREEDRWPATPGSACAYCPIAAKCRERNVLAELSVIVTNADEAQAAAKDLLILDAAYSQRREQLKSWADENGPVEVGDSTVGYVTKAGGLKIAGPEELVQKLGTDIALEQGYHEDDKNRIIALGFEAATQDRLLSIDGNRAKNKGVQTNPRYDGLWVAGDSKTSFGVFKTAKKVEA